MALLRTSSSSSSLGTPRTRCGGLPAGTACWSLLLLCSPLPRHCDALTLSAGNLSVQLDDLFPRPLAYAHAGTGDSFAGALNGAPGFHLLISVNDGQASCGESGIATTYTPLSAAAASYSVSLTCVLNWFNESAAARPRKQNTAAPAALPLVTLQLNGSVECVKTGAGGDFIWTLSSVGIQPGSDPALPSVRSLDVSGFELVSFRPVGDAETLRCFYAPDDAGRAPACGGDTYYVDSWRNSGLDEWFSGTWDSQIVTGSVDINAAAAGHASCLPGAATATRSHGELLSIVVGGWSRSLHTGIAVVSSQSHTPFRSGPRSFDAPGRCSRFTVAPATIHTQFLCGSPLPYVLTVGVFSDLTDDAQIDSDDVHYWRRHQFPPASLLYRTSIPYKLGLDYDAYTPQHGWNRIPFVPDALAYATNLSYIMDGYAQTPILVGWQGLGHDTLYPSLNVVNPALGGTAGLSALSGGLRAMSPHSTLSYHVNTDEAYSHYNGAPNPQFDIGMCRVQVDHASAWASNCSVTHEQNPDCGLRCSISKTRDAVSHGRYDRIAQIFDVVPAPISTIHSDAWRDVGASWEAVGFVPYESESFCGQRGDAAFWGSRGISMGCEGENGQASELMAFVDYFYHGNGFDVATWGRIVSGSSLGFDQDVYCGNPGGKCSWDELADSFYGSARLYQLALTDELLGSGGGGSSEDGGSVDGDGMDVEGLLQRRRHHRFRNGGVLFHHHVVAPPAMSVSHSRTSPPSSSYDPPSTWPYGGDAIPIVNGAGGFFLPLVTSDGTLSADTAHAYARSGGGGPVNASCALFLPSGYALANNTAVGNWNSPSVSFDLDPRLPEAEVVASCNASCWGNTTCAAWGLIKVTSTSGKKAPLCMLFASPVGCVGDTNQWAGSKQPLPVPGGATVDQSWTLPLAWVGKTVIATTISPSGLVPGSPTVQLQGRDLKLIGVTPGWPVRLVAS